MAPTLSIPGVYRRPQARAEGFPRVRTDVAGFIGAAGPRHLDEAFAVDDWKGYVAQYLGGVDPGTAGLDPVPGSTLAATLRSFFANGGRRAWIVNVAVAIDGALAPSLLNDMLGLGASLQPHGLELLLRQDEVSIVVLPDLHAEHLVQEDRFDPVDSRGDPCFGACARRGPAGAPADQRAEVRSTPQRLFGDAELLWAQRYVIERLQQQRWRWFALFAPPPGLAADAAVRWRERLTRGIEETSDIAALYWPWVWQQSRPGAEEQLQSPLGAVAGIFAAVDLEAGPQAAPANRLVSDAVALQDPGVDDEANRLAYDAGVNVLRAFAGRGVQLWGARTLRWANGQPGEGSLAFINARRCLSAIARTAEVVGRPLVFEPSTTLLRIKLHQLMTDYLLRVFATGALAGDSAEDGFFVNVDTVQDSAEGQLVCRIGVALAAPAEFIVFRLGREGGVIERAEGA